MKLISIILAYLFFVNTALAGLPPTTAAGLNQSNTTTFNFKVPASQATPVAGGTLLETGNSNLLINAGFEHTTVSTGWTNSAGTVTENTTNEVQGLKAISIALSGQTLALTQDSTVFASEFNESVQGLVSVRVKTSVAGVRLCARKAGITTSSLCVSHSGSGKWELLKVPFILGITSNGISINTAGNVTGTVLVDDAFLGAVDLTTEVTFVSPWVDAGPMTIGATTTAPTKGTTAVDSIRWRQVGQDYEVEYVYRQTTAGTAGTGGYIFTLPAGVEIDTDYVETSTAIASFAYNSRKPTSNLGYGDVEVSTSNGDSGTKGDVFAISSTQFQVLLFASGGGAMLASASFNLTNANFGFKFTLKFRGKGLSSSVNTYSSNNADTDWQTCTFATLVWQGLGTVSNVEAQCKRQGGDLIMKGKFTAGTTAATEARIPLPLWNGVQVVSKGTSVIPSLQLVGDIIQNGFATNYFRNAALIEPSVAYITFGHQSSTNSALVKVNGNTFASGTIFSFDARVPIEGWQNSNIIIGQFNGLESCKDSYECTDTFSAKVSATGVVSDENLDWINGNCTAASNLYTCTLRNSLVTQGMNCAATITGSVAFGIRAMTTTSTTVSWTTHNTNDGTGSPQPVSIICQKQGADYIGKTAKAVASDQNLSSPGVTKGTVCSMKIATSGVVSDQYGGCVASCTPGTGAQVCTFSTNYWAQTPNCTGSTTANGIVLSIPSISTTSVQFNSITGSSGAANLQPMHVNCHGVRQ